MVQILIPIVCSVLLSALVAALIFSSKFRQDIMVGEGEARVLGVLSVKGVVIVTLSGLFLGALILTSKPLMDGKDNEEIAGFLLDDVIPLIEQKYSSDIRYIDQSVEGMKNSIDRFMEDVWIPRFLSLVVENQNVVEDLKHATSIAERQSMLRDLSNEVLYRAMKKRQDLIHPIDEQYRYLISALHTHYRKILVAAASQDVKTYREMIRTVPQERTLLEQLNSEVFKVLEDVSRHRIDEGQAMDRLRELLEDSKAGRGE